MHVYVPSVLRESSGWKTSLLSGMMRSWKDSRRSSSPRCMVYHVPHQIRLHKNLLQFSGQGMHTTHLQDCYLNDNCIVLFLGVEKNNVHAKHNFYSSNRHDACGEVLRTEKRIEMLDSSCQREKRTYCKKDQQYWSGGNCRVPESFPSFSFL